MSWIKATDKYPESFKRIWSLMNQVTKLTHRVFMIFTSIIIGFSFADRVYWWLVLYHGVAYGLLLYLIHRGNINRSPKKYKL